MHNRTSALALALLTLCKVHGAISNATTADPQVLTRIGFASCNRQYLPQPAWEHIIPHELQLWLWTGDAVYVRGDGGLQEMEIAYSEQEQNPKYQKFLDTGVLVEGVWDDHDYGVNDAGEELDEKPARVNRFLDFMRKSADDPRRGRSTLYSSHTYGEGPRQVKVIFLDTRTQRDPYYLSMVQSRTNRPRAAILGSIARGFSSFFCLGSDHAGKMMGEDQWAWLEEQLRDSQAAVHILVSTVQVLTSNPVVESWGHYPHERTRLLELLDRHRPRGLLLTSGDVHYAELLKGYSFEKCPHLKDASGAPPPPEHILEVTTSGMTHSCGGVYQGTCTRMLDTWPEHRWRPDSSYMYENYGTLDINWHDNEDGGDCERCSGPGGETVCAADLNIQMRNLTGHPVLTAVKSSCHRDDLKSMGLPECAADAVPAGCTARRVSMALASLVFTLAAMWRGGQICRRRLFGGGRSHPKSGPTHILQRGSGGGSAHIE